MERIRRIKMGVSKWHMNRLGLVDFWCYEDDEFNFEDGHMLLRGSNGSGKSVTMQSMIPLLLDGNRSSERLDPFGTRSRKMDTYLIDENSTRDERTGYLYLEFKRADSEIYKTIGMGLRARKNRPLDTWYFVIEDNRRINIDFKLIENRFTLTKKQLENILGNQVINSQKEYMKKVNDSIFGFASLDDYKDAIDLLLQLRSPKLSNSLSPTKINEILAQSLQPLSEDDLRPMSEAITSMDNLQDDLENLNTSLSAAKKINQAYDVYNKVILIDKWQKYNRENDELKRTKKEIGEKTNDLSNLEKEYLQLEKDLQESKITLEIKQNEKRVLIDPNIENLHEELVSLKQQIKETTVLIEQKENLLEIKDNKLIDLENEISKYQDQSYQLEKNYERIVEQLEIIAQDFPFSEHSALKQALANHESFEFDYTKRRLKEELKSTQVILELFNQSKLLEEQIKNLEEEISKLNEQNALTINQSNEAKENYANCIEQYQEYFYHYNNHNQILKLSNQDLNEMIAYLVDYENTQDYHSINQIVHQNYLKLMEKYTKEQSSLTLELKQKENEYQLLESEYAKFINNQEIEPVRDQATINFRQYLDNHQIQYVPLFKLLDFDETIDDQNKQIIEEILMQMGILDALVIEHKDQEFIINNDLIGHDHCLWSNKNLSELTAVNLTLPFSQNSFIKTLNQLGIEVNNDLIITHNYFKTGILEGLTDGQNEAVFIGYQSREAYRQKKIAELKILLSQKQDEIDTINVNITASKNNLEKLKTEFSSFKDDQELKYYYLVIERIQKELDFQQTKINQLLEQKTAKENSAIALYSSIKQDCQKIFVAPIKEAVIARQEAIDEYEINLDLLKENLRDKTNLKTLLSIQNDKLLELQDDVDRLKGETSLMQHQNQVNQGKAKTIAKQLDDLGYASLQSKLEQLEVEINELQKLIETSISNHSSIKTKQDYLKIELETKNQELQQQNKIVERYYDILLQEVRYGFVFDEDENLIKNLRNLASTTKITKTVSDYLGTLQSTFFEQVAYLSQYHLTHEIDELCHETDDVSGHFLIKANYLGKKIPFVELLTILQDKIDSQKLLIMEEDRHIFEEILVNTIGKKIRNRIQASRRWVDKMERYMQDMNTSSGLQLSLKWRSKKAVNDDELDIQNLVSLLEKDYRILKDSDRNKISAHFRNKIKTARELSLDENTTASFHQLIKEVMDYRKWFEFTLYTKKPNEPRKELTNRIFFAYSGGEKAISMYVPLFSAVAAKFESAREDAPCLIALDEAFAGVDENNIDNLFALITKFNFDYIMNSQVLWGDYPSCKSLAIYELFRPNNAPFVTKVYYKWNGHVRKAVIK